MQKMGGKGEHTLRWWLIDGISLSLSRSPHLPVPPPFHIHTNEIIANSN